MNARGLGDRWLAGESLDGVSFAQHARVRITAGRFTGRTGRVALLLRPPPDPEYIVVLDDDASDARVRQTSLAPAA